MREASQRGMARGTARGMARGTARGMARGTARGTCATTKESSARRVSTPVVTPPGSSMSSTPVVVYLGGRKAVESATWRGHTSVAAASLRHPSDEGSPLGPRDTDTDRLTEGSPEQAGGPLERWMAAWAARGKGHIDHAGLRE